MLILALADLPAIIDKSFQCINKMFSSVLTPTLESLYNGKPLSKAQFLSINCSYSAQKRKYWHNTLIYGCVIMRQTCVHNFSFNREKLRELGTIEQNFPHKLSKFLLISCSLLNCLPFLIKWTI